MLQYTYQIMQNTGGFMEKKTNIKELWNKSLPWILQIIIGLILGISGAIYSMKNNIPLGNSFLELVIILTLFAVTLFIHIILHEGGHLIFGLLSNFEFVSFRVGCLTLVKENNKFLIKKFKIAGTGGQCLMIPKMDNYKECPYILYNLGGVILNLLVSIFCFYIYVITPTTKYMDTILLAMVVSGVCTFVLNGIPMKVGGVTNDGYNLISIRKNDLAKYCFYTQLKVNGLLSKGIRFKGMDKKWFELDENSDFSNPLITSIKCLENNYYTDIMDFDKAKKCCEFLLNYEPKIIKLYENELKCDLLFLEIMGNRDEDKINKLYTKELKSYIKATNCYIARKRLMYAYALIIEKDLEKAEKLLKEFKKVQNTYPIKGEIESEVELVNYITDKYNTSKLFT